MKKYISLLIALVLLFTIFPVISFGDETESKGTFEPQQWENSKMHYPQLPDPNGWDICDMYYTEKDEYGVPMGTYYETPLADDWMCSESGYVTDIHWWGSWYYDEIGTILGFNVEIWSDLPAEENPGGYSIPNVLLWSNYEIMSNITVAPEIPSLQGWYEPNPEEPYYEEENHMNYFRYDLENITTPFYQTDGTIYWLHIMPEIYCEEGRGPSGWWGWKTSGSPQWNDAAVYDPFYEPPDPHQWFELMHPIIMFTPLDLAFVITGEPEEEPPSNYTETFYVDQQYNSGTPGWHVTHWDIIHGAVENISAGGLVLVNGDGDVYNENVLIDGKSIDVIGSYTTTRPRINGVSATKSTVEIMSDWVNFSGFYIYNNVGKASYHGIAIGKTLTRLEDYYNVTISDCYITTAADGVLFRGGGYCTIETSEIATTILIGVDMSSGVGHNTIRYCNLHNIDGGIRISTGSYSNSVYNNTLSNMNAAPTGRAIYLNGLASTGNYIYNNNITSNPMGIYISTTRLNNLIYHNNFVNNVVHAQLQNTANLNYWNLSYPYCGNYWSGHGTQDIYGGPDQDIVGSDIICDLNSPDPYTVGGVNIDNYPFLNPFTGILPSFNYPPIQSNEVPTNGTTQSELTAQVSIDVSDTEGDTFDISSHGDYLTNISLAGQTNGTFSANLNTPLPYNTDIWWYVDILDSEGRWVNASYYFHTSPAGNLPPNKPTNENPVNNSDYVLVNSYLSADVSDPDSDPMDVVFYWANGTEIGIDWGVSSGGTASIYLPDYVWLSHNTEYSWYAVVYDAFFNSNTSDIWIFTTCRAYDLNGNGNINYLDVSLLVAHYGESIPDATQEITLRPIADTIVTWTASPPLPAHFLTVMESIPDDPNTFVWEGPPAMGPELFFINAPSYTYPIINVTLNARMSSLAGMGFDIFQHVIWDGFAPLSYDIPTPIMTPFPIFQTYPSSTWIGDPYGGDWTWAKLQVYHFGIDQTGVPLVSPTMMTQFNLDVNYLTPGNQAYDINNDAIVNYLDVSSVVAHYGESY